MIEVGDVDVFTAWVTSHFDRVGPGKSACIVSRPIVYSIAMLFAAKSTYYEQRELRAFYSADEALVWLGVPAEVLTDQPKK